MLHNQPIQPYARCWHQDAQKKSDCLNEQAYQCAHCKWMICEEHMRRGQVGGSTWTYCEKCYAMLYAAKNVRV